MVRQHRRNFLPTFAVNFILWLTVGFFIFNFSPDQNFKSLFPLSIVLFFILFTLALTLTLALVFGHTRRGFFLTLLIDGLLILRLIKQTNWLNIFLLSAIFFTLELYFSRKKTHN